MTIPAFTGCGTGGEDLDRLLTASVSGPGLLRPHATPSPRHGLILVRPHPTHGGALSLRLAAGAQGAGRVLAGRLRRWWR